MLAQGVEPHESLEEEARGQPALEDSLPGMSGPQGLKA